MASLIGQSCHFDKAVAAFAPFLDPAHPSYDPDDRHSARIWLLMPQFPEYVEAFMADLNLFAELEKFALHKVNKERAHTDISKMQIYRQFSSVNGEKYGRTDDLNLRYDQSKIVFPIEKLPEKPIRRERIYPLNIDETELSIDFIDRHMDYEYAFLAIKMCLLDYFVLLKKALKETYGWDINNYSYYNRKNTTSKCFLARGYKAMCENAKGVSLLQDLMPILANRLRQQDEPFAPRAMQLSFADAFRRQAFQSMGRREDGYRKCPFTESLAKLMSISVTQQEDGGFHVQEDAYPGALIVSMRDHIRAHYMQALPANHPVHSAKRQLG